MRSTKKKKKSVQRYNVYVGMDTFGFFITRFDIFHKLVLTFFITRFDIFGRLFKNFPNGIFNSCRFGKFGKSLIKNSFLFQTQSIFYRFPFVCFPFIQSTFFRFKTENAFLVLYF